MKSIKDFDKQQKIENKINIAVDFDGVIHRCSKGYHDGTIYDVPIEDSLKSLKTLKDMGFNIIIFSCKSRSDRPLVNNICGTQMIWDWFKKYKCEHLITDVVKEKPRALIYIDDKGYRFQNWKDTIKFLKELK